MGSMQRALVVVHSQGAPVDRRHSRLTNKTHCNNMWVVGTVQGRAGWGDAKSLSKNYYYGVSMRFDVNASSNGST